MMNNNLAKILSAIQTSFLSKKKKKNLSMYIFKDFTVKEGRREVNNQGKIL